MYWGCVHGPSPLKAGIITSCTASPAPTRIPDTPSALLGLWVVPLAFILGLFVLAASASAQTLNVFAYPGATHTRAFGITPSGEIVGIYVTATGSRGFRLSGTHLIQIDYPGSAVTSAVKINSQGDIVGWYGAAPGGPFHGYLLRKGEYFTIDVPGAVSTLPFGINARGEIVGGYKDMDGDTHAFVLSNGEFTTFDYPGVRFTQFVDINSKGDIVGVYESDGKYQPVSHFRGIGCVLPRRCRLAG